MIVARTQRLVGRSASGRVDGGHAPAVRSLFTTALHPSGTYPNGLAWPETRTGTTSSTRSTPRNMGAIFSSSTLIVLGVVPVSVLIATMAGFGLGHLRVRGGQLVFLLFLLGLTLPFEGVIIPLYYQIRGMGLLNTRWRSSCH